MLAASLAAGAAQAQTPKEGSIDWSMCFGGPTHAMTATPEDRFGTYVLSGGVRGTAGPAESMSVECLGTWEYRGRAGKSQGYCLFQDAAGDKIVGVDSRNAQGYAWEFQGGTGKFAGITGTGTVEIVGAMKPVRADSLQGCRRLLGTYRLP